MGEIKVHNCRKGTRNFDQPPHVGECREAFSPSPLAGNSCLFLLVVDRGARMFRVIALWKPQKYMSLHFRFQKNLIPYPRHQPQDLGVGSLQALVDLTIDDQEMWLRGLRFQDCSGFRDWVGPRDI